MYDDSWTLSAALENADTPGTKCEGDDMIQVDSVAPRGTFVRRAAPHWTAATAVPCLSLVFLTAVAWTPLGELSAVAAEPPIVQIHEGTHWIWYARQDQFQKYAKDIQRYYD